MQSKKSRQRLGKPEGAHEALTLVALVPEAEEVNSDRAVGQRGVRPEAVAEDEAHDGILFYFFRTDIDL